MTRLRGFGRYGVPFVEESVKSLKDECLALFFSYLVRLIQFPN
jgi:hypothetical protein